ncbi:hypothetical protein K474DRAFT_1708826 [Panus rudis PR-1116 ss-1]|nr:hypothetical protein K474DRAFT_1708826 [Panus rudis PR-1116 ss-1]
MSSSPSAVAASTPDIIGAIARWMFRDTLRAGSLVSSTWRAACQPELFRVIELADNRKVRKLEELLDQKPELARYIQGLSIGTSLPPSKDSDGYWSENDPETQAEFHKLRLLDPSVSGTPSEVERLREVFMHEKLALDLPIRLAEKLPSLNSLSSWAFDSALYLRYLSYTGKLQHKFSQAPYNTLQSLELYTPVMPRRLLQETLCALPNLAHLLLFEPRQLLDDASPVGEDHGTDQDGSQPNDWGNADSRLSLRSLNYISSDMIYGGDRCQSYPSSLLYWLASSRTLRRMTCHLGSQFNFSDLTVLAELVQGEAMDLSVQEDIEEVLGKDIKFTVEQEARPTRKYIQVAVSKLDYHLREFSQSPLRHLLRSITFHDWHPLERDPNQGSIQGGLFSYQLLDEFFGSVEEFRRLKEVEFICSHLNWTGIDLDDHRVKLEARLPRLTARGVLSVSEGYY